MWGSTFSDLAKKAQELQEQASHISVQSPSFFNLDAMQQEETDQQQQELFETPHPSRHTVRLDEKKTAAAAFPAAPSLTTPKKPSTLPVKSTIPPKMKPTPKKSGARLIMTPPKKEAVKPKSSEWNEMNVFDTTAEASAGAEPAGRKAAVPVTGWGALNATVEPDVTVESNESAALSGGVESSFAQETERTVAAVEEATVKVMSVPARLDNVTADGAESPSAQDGWDDDDHFDIETEGESPQKTTTMDQLEEAEPEDEAHFDAQKQAAEEKVSPKEQSENLVEEPVVQQKEGPAQDFLDDGAGWGENHFDVDEPTLAVEPTLKVEEPEVQEEVDLDVDKPVTADEVLPEKQSENVVEELVVPLQEDLLDDEAGWGDNNFDVDEPTTAVKEAFSDGDQVEEPFEETQQTGQSDEKTADTNFFGNELDVGDGSAPPVNADTFPAVTEDKPAEEENVQAPVVLQEDAVKETVVDSISSDDGIHATHDKEILDEQPPSDSPQVEIQLDEREVSAPPIAEGYSTFEGDHDGLAGSVPAAPGFVQENVHAPLDESTATETETDQEETLMNGESNTVDESSAPQSPKLDSLLDKEALVDSEIEDDGPLPAPDELANGTAVDKAAKDGTSSIASKKVQATLSDEAVAIEMQRLKESFAAEIQELKQRHQHELEATLASFNHAECETERREMEQRYMSQIQGKEEHIQELMRENEGHQLKIDALKREVTGTQALLQQRDHAMGDASEVHNKNVENLQQKVRELEEAATFAKTNAEKLKEEWQATKTELGASNEAYAALKARVKVVATELKERRVECRTLGASVTELKEINEQLETQITNLQSQLSDREGSGAEKDRELKQREERIAQLESELQTVEKSLKERDAVGEKALSTYKKKAQNALAIANARAAAANQAKEEAEMEASSARSMAEEAVERARVAETSGHKALAEAKASVEDMEKERGALKKAASDATEALKKTTEEYEQVKNALDASRTAQEKLVEDVRILSHDKEEERGRNVELQRRLDESERRSELLYEELETLREELRQSAAAAAAAAKAAAEKEAESWAGWTHTAGTSDDATKSSGAEGTVAMLEGELRDANRAIRELKEALKNAIMDQGSNGHGPSAEASSFAPSPQVDTNSNGNAGPGNESTPLFFAMEKQAELNTARDEINRLANLLGDAESSRMEAYDAMEEMRRKMEEAEARLHRYEKFGPAGIDSPSQQPTSPRTAARDADVNLEYLKNVMLSFMNAKSLAEKKALVPVVATVLCLTPEEQAAALKNVEESGGLEVVGRTLFESLRG